MKTSTIYTFALIVLAVVFAIAAPTSAIAQLKLGYVNSETIIKELPEAKEAKEKLASIAKNWQDELEKMSRDLQDKYEDYQKKSAMLNETAKQAEQKKLIEQEQRLNTYRQEKFGQQGELALQQDKIMTPVKEKILKAIAQVAKEQKVSFVFDKAGDALVLYADPSNDYTYKVLDILKRGSK